MRILVTGADGFVGGAIARSLRREGHDVTGVVFRREPSSHEVRLDLTQRDALEGLELEPEAVVHAAGNVDTNAGRAALWAINADATRTVAGWARRRGVQHLIHASSVSVYGLRVMGEHRTEATPRARHLGISYGRSKAAAEVHLERSGTPFTSLRLPAVFGAGDPIVTPALVPRLVDGRLAASSRGRLFSTLWVGNLSRFVQRLLTQGPLGGHFNCTCGETTWDEFVAAYSEAIGTRERPRSTATQVGVAGLPARLRDPLSLFVGTTRRFGAHYPAQALAARLGPLELRPWQEGVAEAVDHWARVDPSLPATSRVRR